MGFRFRRSVRLFPGVRLNFSGSGISASVGGPGASVTFGPRGSHVNLGLPGTGLSFRQSLGSEGRTLPSQALRLGSPESHPIAALEDRPVPGEIRSADVDQLTSLSLKSLKEMLEEAYAELTRLKADIVPADAELQSTERRAVKWREGFLLKHVFKTRYQAILDAFEEAKAERAALDAEIEKCRIALEIDMDSRIDATYAALSEAFRELANCKGRWDTTAATEVDKVRERSLAARSISRERISLDFKAAQVIAPSKSALHFGNANGGDIYILPGMLLVLGNVKQFALLQTPDVELECREVRFQEAEEVPGDAAVIGETWTKVNKDGSPDRRFANNQRIPIVRYGRLTFRSPSGLNEEFMFSDLQKATRFAEAFAKHRAALPRSKQPEH